MKTLIFLVSLFLSTLTLAEDIPSEEIRLKMFDKLVEEIERIDGEGLPARANRPQPWKETVAILRGQMKDASTKTDLGQVFRKLDATYPNLHAQVVLHQQYDLIKPDKKPVFAVRFDAEVTAKNKLASRILVSQVKDEMLKDLRGSMKPARGDEVIAINGRPVKEWQTENFIYCKHPLAEQCEMNFFHHFKKGLLSWDLRRPLEYTLKRKKEVWVVRIPVEFPAPGQNVESECFGESSRYPDFSPLYKGHNICLYESTKHPGVAVLRIISFAYRELSVDEKIQSLQEEVNQFYEVYWKKKNVGIRKLVIDVIDNGGGDIPVPWYEIFLDSPFQEQFVQFKNLPELKNPLIRQDLFYRDKGKEIWYQALIKEKETSANFLPSVPQFCVHQNQSCDVDLFKPREHQFKGSVRIMVNEWCISSCTGFVWNMKNKLGDRVKIIGVPDSGDSAYARLFVDVYLDPKNPQGFRTEIAPRQGRTRQKLPPGAILRQQVSATRSTDQNGNVVSAIPTPVDVWIPYPYHSTEDPWEVKIFKAALK